MESHNLFKGTCPDQFKDVLMDYTNVKNFVRVSIPTRSGEGASYTTIKSQAPQLLELYENQDFINFISEKMGMTLVASPITDNHRVALYKYSQPGDFIHWHFDKSFYDGQRVTVLIMLHNCLAENNCVLEYEEDGEVKQWFPEHGDLIAFNGDTLRHRVTPYETTEGDNPPRILVTMEYVTDPNIGYVWSWVDWAKNWWAYKF